jgi:anti-sigma regulatory factor (Ser/Thr protein kinase)
MTETLVLLVSEVVTNAVQHTDSPQVIVELAHIDAETMRCAVTDDAAEQGPTVMSTEPSRVGGLGMAIVESLSSRWGCDRDGSSKSVWFELDRPGT